MRLCSDLNVFQNVKFKTGVIPEFKSALYCQNNRLDYSVFVCDFCKYNLKV